MGSAGLHDVAGLRRLLQSISPQRDLCSKVCLSELVAEPSQSVCDKVYATIAVDSCIIGLFVHSVVHVRRS